MTATPGLRRQLTLPDAVAVGLAAMIGAGVFAAFGPAAAVARSGLLLGLALAAVVAYCNATSSARLAALYPESGGTYVYGRRRLGDFWGYLAGWAFVVGKTASCAAMALTFASYCVPGHVRLAASAAVGCLTALNLFGVKRSVLLTRVLLGLTLAALALVVLACLLGGTAHAGRLAPFPGTDARGVLQSAGLLFFAFAGYARVATLGEEVVDPARTIPRAVSTSLAVTVVVYAAVATAALVAVGPARLAASAAPLEAAVRAGSLSGLAPAVRTGAAVAALGSLLSLLLGVSRTTMAMARDRHLPRVLAAIHPRHQVPHRAEVAVGLAVVVLVSTVDLRGAIGFSSFGVLLYYAVANACALTLSRSEGRPPRGVPIGGLVGCLVLAAGLPTRSVVGGLVVLVPGVLAWLVQARLGVRDRSRRTSVPPKA